MSKKIDDRINEAEATLKKRIENKQKALADLRNIKADTTKKIEELTPAEDADLAEFDVAEFVANDARLKALEEYGNRLARKIAELENAPLGSMDDQYMTELRAIEKDANEDFEDKLKKLAEDLAALAIENCNTYKRLTSLGAGWVPSSWAHSYFTTAALYSSVLQLLNDLKGSGIVTSRDAEIWM